MPQLDVSWVVEDPMFATTFDVTRRTDVVGNDGVTTPTEVASFPATLGVVTQDDPAELLRRDDGQMVPRFIFIATKFALRNASRTADGTQYQPDQVTWNGTTYTVVRVYPYSQFGQGMYEAVLEAMNAMDAPDDPEENP